MEATHEKIKHAPVAFPPEHALSDEAKELITKLLAKAPDERPTLDEMLAHPFIVRHAGVATQQ